MLEKFYSRKNHSISEALKQVFLLSTKKNPSTLEDAIALSQEMFLRPSDKERWEIREPFRYKFKKTKFNVLFDQLGLLNPIYPAKKKYNSILLLGAEASDLISRISFLTSLDIKADNVYLLSGKRLLVKKEIQLLEKNHMQLPVWREDFMAEALFPKEISHTVISCSNHLDNTRVNTLDTIKKWVEKYGTSKKNLLISKQPFANYQHLVAKNYVKELHPEILFDIAAPKSIEEKAPISVTLDTIARILYELGKFVPS